MPNVQYLLARFRDRNLIEYVPLKDAEELARGVRITSFRVEHQKDQLCFGFRIDGPEGSLAYVTDTYGEPGASYADKMRGVEVLLNGRPCLDSDAAFTRRVGHSHITPVARLAAEAGVGRLVLIHLSSFRPEHGERELNRAYPIFPRTEVSYDGVEIKF